MGSAALFSGNFVKFLKNKLNLFDSAYILTGSADPRATATDAPKGSILLRQNGSGNGQLFVKLDNGSSTNWQLMAGDIATAQSLLEALKNEQVDSPYELLTPNIVQVDAATKFATLTGAAFDIASGTVQFASNGQVATSIQMADSTEFLSRGLDVGSVDLTVFWNRSYTIPTAFTYELSRDGGTNWFAATMSRVGSTGTFRGNLRFDTTATTEPDSGTIASQTSQGDSLALLTTNAYAQKITIANTTKVRKVAFRLAKTASGSPAGNLYISIIRDNGSGTVPSSSLGDVVCQSSAISVSGLGLTTTKTEYTFDIPDTVLTAGVYHVAISTDDVYKANSPAPTGRSVAIDGTLGGGAPAASQYSTISGTWSSFDPRQLYVLVKGYEIDLRVRITAAGSPAYPCALDGFGVFYNLQDVGIVGATRKTQRFVFNSVTDNTSSFAITNFTPDPDLLSCYYVEGGQVFKQGAFVLNGNTAVFPANSFNNGGVSATVTLVFDQNNGGAFDNSDSNARLLADNHLGSTDPTLDRSVAGRGIVLRRPDGTLREIWIDNNDNINISSLP